MDETKVKTMEQKDRRQDDVKVVESPKPSQPQQPQRLMERSWLDPLK